MINFNAKIFTNKVTKKKTLHTTNNYHNVKQIKTLDTHVHTHTHTRAHSSTFELRCEAKAYSKLQCEDVGIIKAYTVNATKVQHTTTTTATVRASARQQQPLVVSLNYFCRDDADADDDDASTKIA